MCVPNNPVAGETCVKAARCNWLWQVSEDAWVLIQFDESKHFLMSGRITLRLTCVCLYVVCCESKRLMYGVPLVSWEIYIALRGKCVEDPAPPPFWGWHKTWLFMVFVIKSIVLLVFTPGLCSFIVICTWITVKQSLPVKFKDLRLPTVLHQICINKHHVGEQKLIRIKA